MSEWVIVIVLICGFAAVVMAVSSVKDEVVRLRDAVRGLSILKDSPWEEIDIKSDLVERLADILAALDPKFRERREYQKKLEAERETEYRAEATRAKEWKKRQSEWLSQFDKK